jgi:hypothetical protein
LLDPRDGTTTIWVGAGSARNWLRRITAVDTSIFNQRTQAILKRLYEAGYAPRPHLIAYCTTRKEAMTIKREHCRRIGQDFRGAPLGRRKRVLRPRQSTAGAAAAA